MPVYSMTGYAIASNTAANAEHGSPSEPASSAASSSSSAPTLARLQPRHEPESLVNLLQVHAQHFHHCGGSGATPQLYLPPLQPTTDAHWHPAASARGDDDHHHDTNNDDTGIVDEEEDEGIFELDL